MTKLDEALGLFPSVIKCGEQWSSTCQAVLEAAKAELAALRASAAPEESKIREALEKELAYWMNNSVGMVRHDIAKSFDRMLAALPSDSGKAEPMAWLVQREKTKEVVFFGQQANWAKERGATITPLYTALAPATEGGGREIITDEMLNAHLKACGEWLEPVTASRESGVAIDCDFTQRDCDQFNAEARDRLRVGYLAALSPSPSVGTPEMTSAQRNDGAE